VTNVPTVILWDQIANKIAYQFSGYRSDKLKELMDSISRSLGQQPSQKKLKNGQVQHV
jgi:hypothetical protein